MDRAQWAADLMFMAKKLETMTGASLRKDDELYSDCQKLIHRFAVQDDTSGAIEAQVQYPPEWDNLVAAVENVDPNVLLDNMWGWVSVGRWMDAPLAEIHEKGWLVPALKRLANHVDDLDIELGVDF